MLLFNISLIASVMQYFSLEEETARELFYFASPPRQSRMILRTINLISLQLAASKAHPYTFFSFDRSPLHARRVRTVLFSLRSRVRTATCCKRDEDKRRRRAANAEGRMWELGSAARKLQTSRTRHLALAQERLPRVPSRDEIAWIERAPAVSRDTSSGEHRIVCVLRKNVRDSSTRIRVARRDAGSWIRRNQESNFRNHTRDTVSSNCLGYCVWSRWDARENPARSCSPVMMITES